MATISVGQLKQNPSAALDALERGESYVITRYRRPVGMLTPLAAPRAPVTGAEVMELLRRTPVDAGWAGDLEEFRASAAVGDPWEQA
jgi:antitoxin (DNA-binding transcriptional repressor) of toxin-antitoxin stability system